MLANLTLSAVVVLLLVGLFELYLANRFAREHERLEQRYPDRELCTQAAADSRLIYDFVPGRCGVNDQGFMDKAWDRSANGAFRIALIGDSVAQGQGVERDHRFGNQLESILNQDTKSKVTVMNFARSGYSTSQELIVLEEALAFSPDLVLWSYVLNDPAHPTFHDANGELGRYYYRPTWRGLYYVQRKWFQARENFRRGACSEVFHEMLHCVYASDVQRHLAELARILRERDVQVLFVIHPFLQGDRRWAEDATPLHEQINQMATSQGLETLDLLDAYADFEPAMLAVELPNGDRDPWHPNAQGHRLAAVTIADRIRSLGLLGD